MLFKILPVDEHYLQEAQKLSLFKGSASQKAEKFSEPWYTKEEFQGPAKQLFEL